MKNLSQQVLDQIVAKTASKKIIHGATFRVEAADSGTALTSAAGNLQPDVPFYIASINKLMISA
ncbi:MAG: hypothetical protein LPK09_10150, partial [Hymenobacteraceae bacterium]|nr:hypothetical protein [Hymenobacteraceae bacterium]